MKARLTPDQGSRRFARRTELMSRSAIREILKLTQKADVISFAGGLPAKEIFPVSHIVAACEEVFSHGPEPLQYSTTEGYRPLIEYLAEFHTRRGIPTSADDIQILSGSQQGLDLLGKIYLDPGDPVIVEDPTYLGALQAFSQYEASYITVPTDEQGMVLDDLEDLVAERRPKLIYAVPNFHNPLGVTMSLERRQRLVELARRYSVLVIEDDPYHELRYVGVDLPSLHTLAGGVGVVYLGTFSKTIAPGFRVGWLIGPEELREKIVSAKQASDLHTGSASQRFIFEYCRAGWFESHLPVIRATYGQRLATMLDSLSRDFPREVRWTVPEGGLFIWVTLPEGFSAEAVLREAMDTEKVAFIPGTAFYATDIGHNTLRLNFSYSAPEVIQDGINRLGCVVRRCLARGPSASR